MLTEEELIEAVVRVKLSAPDSSAAEVLKALENEGVTGLNASTVKKACSKAAKRGVVTPKAEATSKVDTETESKEVKESKSQLKQAKAHAAALKAAERAMMDAQRALQCAKYGQHAGAAAHINGTIEEFIQKITAQALAGTLGPGIWLRFDALILPPVPKPLPTQR